MFVTRKYKPVALKTQPVLTELPNKFRIIHNIGDPLADIPTLSCTPPPFQPTGRYTAENHDIINKAHPSDFLWPSEWQLIHHFMSVQNQGFMWNDMEHSQFHKDFFPPIVMPIVEHMPWVFTICPPSIYDEVYKIIQTKIDAGVYE